MVINYNSVGPWTQPEGGSKGRERAPLINEPSTRPSLFSSPTFTVQPTFHYSSYYKSLINFFQLPPPPPLLLRLATRSQETKTCGVALENLPRKRSFRGDNDNDSDRSTICRRKPSTVLKYDKRIDRVRIKDSTAAYDRATKKKKIKIEIDNFVYRRPLTRRVGINLQRFIRRSLCSILVRGRR